jgi:hypothetical protein
MLVVDDTDGGGTDGTFGNITTGSSGSHTHNVGLFQKQVSSFSNAVGFRFFLTTDHTFILGAATLLGSRSDAITTPVGNDSGSGANRAIGQESGTINNEDPIVSGSGDSSHTHTFSHALSNHQTANLIMCEKS